MASALVARFGADFTDFLTTVQKAEQQLRSFESGSEKVQTALNKMANSFSGTKIIQDATLMTKAVEQAGGASTLTAKEMARVNATLNEAIEKYRALGGTAPPAMQSLADATKNTDNASGGFMDKLGKMTSLLGALGIGFSVGAIVNFGKSLLSDADELVKLHDKTAITLQDLQRLQIVGDDAGVSLEDMAGAVNKLQKNLGSDNEGANQALQALGLNLEDIRALTPENQFYEIAAALQKVKDPAEQVALAVALFGKNGAELLPVIKKGFDDVRHAAVGMSDDTVENLDAVGDAFSKMWRTTKGVVANMLVDVFNPTIAGFREAAATMKGLKEATDKLAPPLAKVMPYHVVVDVKEFDRAMEHSGKTITDTAARLKAQNDALDAVNKKIADATRGSKDLTAAQENVIVKYKALGLSNEEIALKTGIAAVAVADFTTELDRNRKAAEALEPKMQAVATRLEDLGTKMPIQKVQDMWRAVGVLDTNISGVTIAGDKVRTIVPLFGTILPDAVGNTTDAVEETKKATDDWGAMLAGLSDDFVQMAQIGGAGFSEVGRAVGMSVKAFEQLNKVATTMSGPGGGFSASNLTALAAGYVGVAIAAYQVTSAIMKARDAAAQLRDKLKFDDFISKSWMTSIHFSDQLTEAHSPENSPHSPCRTPTDSRCSAHRSG